MRGRFVRTWLVAGMVLVPARARAQHDTGGNWSHEFGVDLSLVYAKPVPGSGFFSVGTPVDLRFGLVTPSGWSIEPRLILQYQSGTGHGALTDRLTYNYDVDLNVLVPLGHASNSRRGLYATGGGGLDWVGYEYPTPSGTLFQLNAGIGTRIPLESAALRVEAYAKYQFKSNDLGFPHTAEVGTRIGLSLWH